MLLMFANLTERITNHVCKMNHLIVYIRNTVYPNIYSYIIHTYVRIYMYVLLLYIANKLATYVHS